MSHRTFEESIEARWTREDIIAIVTAQPIEAEPDELTHDALSRLVERGADGRIEVAGLGLRLSPHEATGLAVAILATVGDVVEHPSD